MSSIKQLARGEEYPHEILQLQHDGDNKDLRGYYRLLQESGSLCRMKGDMVLKSNWGQGKRCTMFVFNNTANGYLDSPMLNPNRQVNCIW